MTTAPPDFRMPAEWEPHAAIWLSWPVRDPRHWGGAKADLIESKFAEFAAAITQSETVRINANPGDEKRITSLCLKARAVPERLEVFTHPHNDVWCRDHGPIFIKNPASGEKIITDWDFNAWGEKFPPWDLDNLIPQAIASALNLKTIPGKMILEGGAIEVNNLGQLLTTEAVLLNPNRNPQLTRSEIETLLRQTLGIHEVLWLARGIEGDDTDGHIDDLARFTNDHTIVACHDPDPSSPNHQPLTENHHRLLDFRTPSGRPLDLDLIHLPAACEVPGWRLPVLPASYVNFLILNETVLVPTFRQKRNDDRALGIIQDHFPNHRIHGIDCLDLVEEGGTLHCLSQQEPS